MSSGGILPPGCGPRHIWFDKRIVEVEGGRETKLYILNEMGNSVASLKVFYEDGKGVPEISLLEPVEGISILPPTPSPHQSSFDKWHASDVLFLPPPSSLIGAKNGKEKD